MEFEATTHVGIIWGHEHTARCKKENVEINSQKHGCSSSQSLLNAPIKPPEALSSLSDPLFFLPQAVWYWKRR